MNVDYTVTALMFPAIPLLMNVYGNRFHTLSALIRKIHDEYIWDKHKFDIVVNANYLKFTQDETLKKLLLSTRDKTIVEASPEDNIWGIGLLYNDNRVLDESNWQGENLLGKAIMKVRTMLKEYFMGLNGID